MNHFDVIYIINLKHRTDRLESILGELKKMNVPDDKIVRINAIYNKERGYLGCTQSHRLALSLFLKSKHNNCLVLEDDFIFCQNKEYVDKALSQSFLELNFDVLMLAGNLVAISTPDSTQPYVKIYDAQTTSAYCVTREFAPKLIDVFKESEHGLNKYYGIWPEKAIKHTYACDMIWKTLQPTSNWYCMWPKLGIQKEGYSDVEMKDVDYKC